MNKVLTCFLFLLLFGLQAAAQTVSIERYVLGSGEPGQAGFENAEAVENNIYHVPQYLPGSPTSAMLWARVIQVPCHREGDLTRCEGYHWSPAMGRAEYLYFTPVLAASSEAPAR
jgi:hypothetical protein